MDAGSVSKGRQEANNRQPDRAGPENRRLRGCSGVDTILCGRAKSSLCEVYV